MTYLFKLARRMAFARRVPVLALFALGCSEAAPREFLSPDPGTHPTQPAGAVTLVVTSAVSELPYDQVVPFVAWGREADGDSVAVAVSWTASAGVIASDGTYRGTIPGTHVVRAFAVGKPSLTGSAPITVSQPGPLFSSLTISPKPVYISGGARVAFAATARLQSGANTLPAVTWSASGGSISPAGEFLGPLRPGSYQVVATSLDRLVTDTALVVVDPPALTALQLQPRVVTIPGGATQDFTVAANWSDGTTQVPDVEWQANGGTVAPLGGVAGGGLHAAASGTGGRFTANKEPGTYKVVVRHPTSGKTDTASVTITPVLDRIELTPGSVDLNPGSTKGFSATGWLTNGSPAAVSVSWTATGGTISGTGVYSAGPTPGSFRVIARTSSGTLADTAVVQISPPAASLTRLTLSPRSGSAPVGGVIAFSAQALWSDGSGALPVLTWSAPVGSITQDGRWTAPATAGSYRVIVRQATGTVADTALIEVVVPAPSLSALSISPGSPSVLGGQSVEFATQATWTNGSTAVPPLTWSATGGTVSGAGRWTAPNVSGVYRVVARQSAGTLADTAVVTVTETPRVTTIRVEPGVAALYALGTMQFTATATWSDGLARTVPFTWTATGGSISMEGFFTAGNLAGQFLVIATCLGCSVADTTVLSITEPVVPAPVVNQIVLNPSAVTMGAGEGREFSVAASWSDGSTTLPPLVWTANGGAMQGVHYIAGNTAGTFLLIVRHAGSAVADTATVTITGGAPAAATLSALSLNPSSVTMVAGEQRTLTVGATWSDGSTTVPPLAWEATGGTLNGLVYTAGTTAGSYRVIVTHQASGKADTTAVTVLAADPLVSLTVSPDSTFVPIGLSVSFGISGKSASGATVTTPVTWSATGGSITQAGVYTPTTAAGTFRVVATCATCSLADTAVVVVGASSAPPPPTGSVGDLVVFPNEEIEFIIGPQLKSGAASNPWPWFDQNLNAKGIEHGANFPTTSADGNLLSERMYYDMGLVLYTAYYKSGDVALLTHARRVADVWWTGPAKSGTNMDFDNSAAPRGAALGALMLRALDGRPEMWPWITAYTRTMYQIWLGARLNNPELYYGVRDGGYMLLYAAWLGKAHPDAVVRAEFRQKALDAATQYYARLQYPDGSWRWTDADASVTGFLMQPFMVGLLLDGMVATHRLTGDARILTAITKSVENIYAVAYRGNEPVVQKPGVTWRGMWYTVYGTTCQTGCGRTTLDGGWDTNGIREIRQMNPTTLHAFGYAYKMTGRDQYRQWGDDVFAATFGKGQGPLADAYYGLADFREKEYNAAYRSSGRYLAWRIGN